MLRDIHEGMAFTPVVKQITQKKINLYAEASGDFNPIHVDESFAANTPFGGTIAHGMLNLAYVSEMMASVFGQDWSSSGRLRARFKEVARPGDTLTISSAVSSIEDRDCVSYANCSFEVRNQKDEVVVAGEATAKLSRGQK